MKKILLTVAILGFVSFVFPSRIKAQYTVPYYNDMGYITAQRAAARAAAKARYRKVTAQKKAKKKVVRRKSRRVSSLLMDGQRFKNVPFLTNKIDIV